MRITTNPVAVGVFILIFKCSVIMRKYHRLAVLIDVEWSVVSAVIKRYLVELHCDVSVG